MCTNIMSCTETFVSVNLENKREIFHPDVGKYFLASAITHLLENIFAPDESFYYFRDYLAYGHEAYEQL